MSHGEVKTHLLAHAYADPHRIELFQSPSLFLVTRRLRQQPLLSGLITRS